VVSWIGLMEWIVVMMDLVDWIAMMI